ncbi:MAG TPA: tetratricopeptide repeat protein, partial [Planctomycetaceae bacterium]|nr:tetratricopeptide repeat protein [Planctomycetaceae bacterium]
DAQFPPAWTNLGICEATLGNDEAAIEALSRALLQNPSQADAWLERSACLFRQGKITDALRDANEAIDWGGSARTFSHRGYLLKRQGRLEAALADYNRALALDPDLVDALANRGAILGQMRRPDRALVDFTRALEIQPELSEVYRNRAVAHYQTGQIDLARSDLEQYRARGGEPPPEFVRLLSGE